jgi:hypothetical protein
MPDFDRQCFWRTKQNPPDRAADEAIREFKLTAEQRKR